MPFAIQDRNPARIPGDFQIEPVQGYNPQDPERDIVALFTRSVDRLAEQAAVDASAGIRDRILQARVAFRTEQIANLRAVAATWVDGADPGAVTGRVAEIAGQIDGNLPDVKLAGATDPRFTGDFAAKITNYAPEAAEQAYLDAQAECVDSLAIDEAADSRAGYPDAGLQARRTQRAAAIARLKDAFASWKNDQLTSDAAARQVSWARGYYAAQRDRLTRKLFTVKSVRGERDEEARYNVALDIRMAEGLPPPNDQPSQDQRDLFVEINRAETVIDIVCRQIRARAHSRFWKRPEEDQRGLRLLGEYVDKLAGIAGIGLEQSHTALAKLALNSLREEFIAREAGEILNRYVRRLGAWSFGFAALFLLSYILVRNNACTSTDPCTSWWFAHRSFLLAAAGASFGTWASFSVRQVNLTFEQLAAPEDQLLDAPLRVIFVVMLTMAACLLFWTSAINVKVGDLNTEASWFSKVGTVAILIGFFCGLSERALSSAIAGRATAFVGGIAGSR